MWEDHTPWPLDYSDMLTLHVHWSHIRIFIQRIPPLPMLLCATWHALVARNAKGWTDFVLFWGVLNPCTHVTMQENNMLEDHVSWSLDYCNIVTLRVHWSHIHYYSGHSMN
jgi:hypothetical protein